MAELDPRKDRILRAVVLEYVDAAEPVASELIVRKYELGVKSATIRNELSELSELGYLEQPHTSSGRVPSDIGYRYFVDYLVDPHQPGESQKSTLRKATEEGEALQNVLRDAAKTLSRMTHLLGAATTVRNADLTIKNVVVSALGPKQALLVLVLSNGQVENRLVECPLGLTLEDVGKVNEALNLACAGKAIRSVLRHRAPTLDAPAAEKMTQLLWTTLRVLVREFTKGSVTTEGEEYLFAQPEFQGDANALSRLLDELRESDLLFDTLAASKPQMVTIGREHRHEKLHRLSIVRQAFYVGEDEAGTIAIIGPTRMPYASSMSLVELTARALSDSLTRFLA